MNGVFRLVGVGEDRTFPGRASIRRRIRYEEKVGVSDKGHSIFAALAYNPEGPSNVWFVCLIVCAGEVLSCKPTGQTRTLPSVKGQAMGWEREVAHQLKRLTLSQSFLKFESERQDSLLNAILKVWPEGLPTDGGVMMGGDVAEQTRKNAERADKREESPLQLEMF